MLDIRPPDDPLNAIYTYWNGLVENDPHRIGGLPSLTDIDPPAIPSSAVSYMLLIDVGPELERRYRYRLVGTEIEFLFGADYTGKFMDEIVPSPLYDQVKEAYDRACAVREPVVFGGAYVRQSGEFFNVTRLALPLETVPGTVDCILSAAVRD